MYTLMAHFKVEEIQASIPLFSFECLYVQSLCERLQPGPCDYSQGGHGGSQSHDVNKNQSMAPAKCSIAPKTPRVTHTAKL